MRPLPVVVGYGGLNAAGRASFDQAYRRMILESLPEAERHRTVLGLAAMMGLVSSEAGSYRDAGGATMRRPPASLIEAVVDGTLIRRIENYLFDPDAVPMHKTVNLQSIGDDSFRFQISARDLPEPLPAAWSTRTLDKNHVEVTVKGKDEWLVHARREFPVKAAGQLPRGFNPGSHYNSRFQPRGLQMAIVGASDAVNSLGIAWSTILERVRPDEIGVYACSALGQMNDEAWGGVLKSRLLGVRPNSKQVPMALNSMPADFVNAYVLGSVGHTEAIAGACASFLYNLQAAVRDISEGRRRVAMVGGSEAPVTHEVMDGFFTMSALASEDALSKIDGQSPVDPRRYSRPFGLNAGFAMGESSQYAILMDDSLAVELGAQIHGAVPAVYMDADGFKKSISSTGPGNYITFAKTMAMGRAILGEKAVQRRSLVMAHGSSTPLNRTTESQIFDRLAQAYGMSDWPVCAVKAYLGHSMATASGDQFSAAIGTMRHGWIPGIKTINNVAPDVYQKRLDIPLWDLEVGAGNLDMAFINAKGFGGNNATGLLLSPAITEAMLHKRHGKKAWKSHATLLETTREQAAAYEEKADRGDLQVIYRFGEGMIDEDELQLSTDSLVVPGFANPVNLDFHNPYKDMV